MSAPAPVFVAAGGTGGHLFPAEALAAVLQDRGYAVELVTDARALRYGGTFPARAVHTIAAATPTGGSPWSKAMAALTLARGLAQCWRLMRAARPACVVGFGGYPTVPPLLAARLLGAPAILHEQNAVIGRANRFLAGRVQAIATGFPDLAGIDEKLRAICVHTGNPVRPAVLEAARTPFRTREDGRLDLLVTGGSQGARVMSEIVPAAIGLLEPALRARLDIVQQARGEDEARVRETYANLGVAAEIAPFFADLPQRMAHAHLVVARAGASTVSELAVIGRPSILVPYPFALDQDQVANAAQLAASGAAIVIAQSEFTAQWLAGELARALADELAGADSGPAGLTARAEAAKSAGVPDAAARLADLVGTFVRP